MHLRVNLTDIMLSLYTLKEELNKRDDRIRFLQQELQNKENEIMQLKSQLDKFQV